jgi:MSHA pilin protein MshB
MTRSKIKLSGKVNMKKNNGFINQGTAKTKTQQGFTLIELVVVVVILGFLAVTAIPKFIDLTEQAKQANIEGMAGGFATGVSLARSQWEAEGRPQNTSDENTVNYDGSALFLTTPAATNITLRAGYPMGTATGGLTSGNMNDTRCTQVWENIFAQPPRVSSSITTLNSDTGIKYYVDTEASTGANSNTICVYFLKESLDKDSAGSFVAPTATTDGNNFTYDPASSAVVVNINNG